jgi:hypothetical protein
VMYSYKQMLMGILSGISFLVVKSCKQTPM